MRFPERAHRWFKAVTVVAVAISLGLALPIPVVASESPDSTTTTTKESFWDRFRDTEDGAFDLDNLIAGGTGFMPIPVPITEPAVGFGIAGLLLYVHPSSDSSLTEQGDRIPPSMSVAGGGVTENGTWAAALAHKGVWKQGRIRYLGALFYASANLTFYGTAGMAGTGTESVSWNIDLGGTLQKLQFQVAPRLFVGAKYLFVNTKNRLDLGKSLPEVPEGILDSRLGGLGLSVAYDGRDNAFTPNDGLFGEISATRYDEALGGDFDYNRVDLAAFGYLEIGPVVFGARLQGASTSDGAPFYGLPFLVMRGVPAFRYVGAHTALGEIEPRWKLSPRWSLVGFFGAGRVAAEWSEFADAETITAGGGGFRYLIARKMGLGVGADLARGPEETAFYIIVGGFWHSI